MRARASAGWVGGRRGVGRAPYAMPLERCRRSPVAVGYTSAGYTTELAAFRQRITDGGDEAPGDLAELEQLVTVYAAFEWLLQSRELRWN